MFRSQPLYFGIFTSYEEALANTDTLDSFQSEQWIKKQINLLNNTINSKRNNSDERPQNLDNFITSISNRDSLNVVDLGGGSGWTFFTLSQNNRRKIEKYIVFENSNLINATTEFLLKQNPNVLNDNILLFAEQDNFVKKKIKFYFDEKNTSILYCNSVIQYLPSLNLINEVGKEFQYILIEDVTEHQSLSFWTLQEYYHSLIPRKIFSKIEVVSRLESFGFKLLNSFTYGLWKEKRQIRIDKRNNVDSPQEIILLDNPMSYLFEKAKF